VFHVGDDRASSFAAPSRYWLRKDRGLRRTENVSLFRIMIWALFTSLLYCLIINHASRLKSQLNANSSNYWGARESLVG